MKAFLGVCLLFGLVSPVLLLICNECQNLTGTECTNRSIKKCTYRKPLCKSRILDANVFVNSPQATYRCGTPLFCEPGHYSFTAAEGKFFNLLVKCCNTANCNAQPLQFPSEPMTPNGAECSGCYAEYEEKCEGSEVVKCLGKQTKCINMNLYVSLGSVPTRYAIRGCATPDMCNQRKLFRSMTFANFIGSNITVKCGDAV